MKSVDRDLIDNLGPNGMSKIVGSVSSLVSKMQSGFLYHYVLSIIIGLTLFISLYTYIFLMLNLPILPILICIPLIGLIFILLSSENDDFALQSKRSALWTSASNFMLSLYLPFNFDKDIPHFQFVNSFEWFNSENLKFSLGVDGLSMPFIILSTF